MRVPEIHVHIHGPIQVVLAVDADVAELKQGLRTANGKLDALLASQEIALTKIEDFRAKVAATNANLDAISADVQRLKDLILAGQKGLTEAEADEALGLLQGIQDRTAAIDAETPEPEPAPEPTPEPPAEPA